MDPNIEIGQQQAAAAEAAIIGALLMRNDAIDRIDDLSADSFLVGKHRAIYATVRHMIEQGERADELTVAERMTVKGHGFADALPLLNSMASAAPSVAGIEQYARIVRDHATKRALRRALLDAQEATASQSALAVMDELQGVIEELGTEHVRSQPRLLAELIPAFMDSFDRRCAAGAMIDAISTGLVDLDGITAGGMRKQELWCVAGRPSMGKTALALSMARRNAEQCATAFFSMEQSQAAMVARVVAATASVDSRLIRDPRRASPDASERIAGALDYLSSINLTIDDEAAQTLLAIRLKCKALKRRRGLRVAYIDYLGLMTGGEGDNRTQQMGSYSRGLKALAKELDITVVLLAQLNRDVERRADRRPQLADLRDSGEIEQDVDVAVFVHRPEFYNPNDEALKEYAELLVRKNREGEIGDVPARFIGRFTRFENWAADRPRPIASPTKAREDF